MSPGNYLEIALGPNEFLDERQWERLEEAIRAAQIEAVYAERMRFVILGQQLKILLDNKELIHPSFEDAMRLLEKTIDNEG
jgi:hypothetical protein